MSEILNEIYSLCTGIHISPFNANTRKEVVINADLSIKHKSGVFHYSKVNICRETLNEALNDLHYLVMGHKRLIEEMP